MSKHSFTTFLFFLLAITSVNAQTRSRYHNIRSNSSIIENTQTYIDSLQILRARLDSLQHERDSLRNITQNIHDSRFYRLFTPMTYYPGILESRINGTTTSLGDDIDSGIDSVLVNMYATHPEHLKTSQQRLQDAASKTESMSNVPVERKVEVTKNVAQEKEEAIQTAEPVEVKLFRPNFWKFSGDYSLQFLQNYISDNWYKGGESNLSMVGAVTLKLNYNNKQKVKFENTLEMKLGLQTSESDTIHAYKSSTDLLRYTGKLGLQATKRWYYTAQVIATTQFMRGYKSNSIETFSDFLSPLTVNTSVGMDYTIDTKNKKLTGSAHLAPFAHNLKYVDRLSLSTRYGLREGRHTLDDFGSQFTINLTWKPSDNVKWESRLYGYTTYHRSELEWENTITFIFSKYISTKLFVYPRFDDGSKRDKSSSYWQLKEYFSLGFSYSM